MPSFIMWFRWYSVFVGKKKHLWWNKSTKSMVQLDEFAITISLGLASRKKMAHVFCSKSHEGLGTQKNAMLFNGIWHGHMKIMKVPYLKSSNRNWQQKKLMDIRTEIMFFLTRRTLETKQQSNALMVLFSTTTWDRIISHRIQWILLEDMNETWSVKIGGIPNVKTPSLFYWNFGG